MNVRVRFTADQAGCAGIGSLRTALFNWLFARHHLGVFILNIRDIDRNAAHSAGAMIDGLRWLGIDWDEGPGQGGEYGPYAQSERLALYRHHARQLVDAGRAYPCYCSSQRLSELYAAQKARDVPPHYDGHCRTLPAGQRAHFEAQGIEPAIRFKRAREGDPVAFDRDSRQKPFQNDALDDVILLTSHGLATPHLSNAIDDHLMAVTHVILDTHRLPDMPYQVLLC
ncbi:MAG: glutamate--tRNA ligase, partial [Anaerolineae bacterium]|nr:glutamate--tRNA ligase [Anaerolineae bacterium]